MNKKLVLSSVAILAAAIGLTMFLWGEKYTPKEDFLVFEREVEADGGLAIDASTLVSTEGVRLTDIFLQESKKFSAKSLKRYGAERPTPEEPGGYGLKLTFVTKDGDKILSSNIFQLKGWLKFEQTTRPNRRKELTGSQPELAKAIEAFTGPVAIKRAFGVALDTTEGVSDDLAKRVRQIVDETRAVQLGADGKNKIALNLYHISEDPYQGGRQRPNLGMEAEVKASTDWLVEGKAKPKSSVLRGLMPILKEMMENKDSRPKLHIFTDGLENLPEASVYKNPELLEEANWSKLDQIADIGALNLKGLTVHLHPLPVSRPALMEKGLKYLENRLKKAGAQVKIEAF